LLVERVAHSRYAKDTLIFVIEDDSQDGPDHVDSHRSIGYVVDAYVKHGAVVSTRYRTVSMLRTMEDVLGLEHLSLHDGNVAPMTDVFDINQGPDWTYSAKPAQALLSTKLPIASAQPGAASADYKPLHDAAWWTEHTKSFRFDKEDLNDEHAYDRVLWEGTMGDKPFPSTRSRADLRNKREDLLKGEKLSENDDRAMPIDR
jgi:hypothetical protein